MKQLRGGREASGSSRPEENTELKCPVWDERSRHRAAAIRQDTDIHFVLLSLNTAMSRKESQPGNPDFIYLLCLGVNAVGFDCGDSEQEEGRCLGPGYSPVNTGPDPRAPGGLQTLARGHLQAKGGVAARSPQCQANCWAASSSPKPPGSLLHQRASTWRELGCGR